MAVYIFSIGISMCFGGNEDPQKPNRQALSTLSLIDCSISIELGSHLFVALHRRTCLHYSQILGLEE